MKVNVNLIATRKYIDFVQPLVDSIEKYFLIDHDILINLFTDQDAVIVHNRADIKIHKIPSYGFPDATTRRFEIMLSANHTADMNYYLDADMLINNFVGDEIIGDIVAVRHPGYFIEPLSGSWETREQSSAFVPKENRIKYFAGGFQGWSSKTFRPCLILLNSQINFDRSNGIEAVWNDESHWNKMLSQYDKAITELNPSYCMPQAWSKRVYSKIEHLPAKILALEKPNDIRK